MSALCCDFYAECGVRDRLTPVSATTASTSDDDALLLGTLFEPSVLLRLPVEDRPGMQFPAEISMFCFPVRST